MRTAISRPRANANPCPMVFTAKDALLITPSGVRLGLPA
jgi:hypothetical protein